MGKRTLPLEIFENYFTQICKNTILLLETKILSKELETSWLKMKFTLGNFKISSNKWYDWKSLKALITYSEALQNQKHI